MKGTIKKWGNSAAVRIPAVLDAAQVDLDQVVDVRYTLAELMAQCNPKKRVSREERERVDAPLAGVRRCSSGTRRSLPCRSKSH
jgi:hypothetical protein